MKKYLKRILALVLAVAMVVPNVPMSVSAVSRVGSDLEFNRAELQTLGDGYVADVRTVTNALGLSSEQHYHIGLGNTVTDATVPVTVTTIEHDGSYEVGKGSRQTISVPFVGTTVYYKASEEVAATFKAKIYDNLTVKVDRPSEMPESEGGVTVDSEFSATGGTYKVYIDSVASISVKDVEGYSWIVSYDDYTSGENTGGEVSLTGNGTVTVTYSKNTSSIVSVNTSDKAVVKINGEEVATGNFKTFEAGVSVKIEASTSEANYEISEFTISPEVEDSNSAADVIEFITPAESTTYEVSASSVCTDNTIKLAGSTRTQLISTLLNGTDQLESVKVAWTTDGANGSKTYNNGAWDLTSVLEDVPKEAKVTITVAPKNGIKVESIVVNDAEVQSDNNKNVATFTTGSGKNYEIAVNTTNTNNQLNLGITGIEDLAKLGATAVITYNDANDSAKTANLGNVLLGINDIGAGSAVSISVTATDGTNYDITNLVVSGVTATATTSNEGNTQSISFTAGEGQKYSLTFDVVSTLSYVVLDDALVSALEAETIASVEITSGATTEKYEYVDSADEDTEKDTLSGEKVTILGQGEKSGISVNKGQDVSVKIILPNGYEYTEKPDITNLENEVWADGTTTFTTTNTSTTYTVSAKSEKTANTYILDDATLQQSKIIVKVGNQDLKEGPVSIKGDTTVTITSTDVNSYSITKVEVIKNNDTTEKFFSEEYLHEDSVTIKLENVGKANDYEIVVTVESSDNKIKLDENTQKKLTGEDAELASITVAYGTAEFVFTKDNADTAAIVPAETENVELTAVAKAGIGITGVSVDGLEDEDTDNTAKFVADLGTAEDYVLSVTTDDITSSIKMAPLAEGEELNATVTVKAGDDAAEDELTSNSEISGILPGEKVTVTITPADNYYIANASDFIKDTNENVEWNLGVAKIEFIAGVDKVHEISVTTKSPVLAKNETGTVGVNAYDILKMQEGDTSAEAAVKGALWTAFKSETLNSKAEIEYQYVAGTIDMSKLGLGQIPIWLPINESITSVDEIAEYIVEWADSKLVTKKAVVAVLNAMGVDDVLNIFHKFGAQETETIKAIFAGNDYIPAAEAEATVKIEDLRAESATTAKDFSFTYGSNLTHAQLVELAKAAVSEKDGSEITWNANDIEFSVKDLANLDAGTYENITVSFKGNYDYKPSTSETITVTVNKANATVTMTDDNVVKYENRAKLLQDGFLYTITPEVAIEDTVAHIPFSMGMDAVDGKLAAKVDLSKMLGDVDAVTLEIIKGILGNELTLSLDDFLGTAKDLVLKLEELGLDTGLTEDTFKVIYGILEEAAGTVDVEVTITLDGTSYIPQNHGVYLTGVVTTDPNYNTAYGVTYIVITAEPVVVYFIDENGEVNHDRQFVFDGTQHAMTAQAYELDTKTGEAGDKLEGGTYSYYYVGVQSDGTPYASSEAPVHAGAYTVTAMYYGGDTQAPELFGMTTGAMTIWANDIAKVDVTDKVVTYDEKNPTEVNVMDMITVDPDGVNGDKAKIAVITAGLNVAGDFSEDGLSALNGVVNVDFPEKADEILKKIVPSAYSDGITLATLNSKLAEIKEKLAEYGIDTAVIDEVIATIESIPDVTTLTFKEQSEVNPVNIGAYFVAAVVFDPDYIPDADAGILLITPEVTEEVLEWTYNDDNGVITLPIISGSEPVVDLGAVATVNPDVNNAKIKYLFVGIDDEGNTVKTDNAAELGNGVYTEIAYIPVEADAAMMIAKPIVRTIVIAPQNVHVDFIPDENIDNARIFTYTGSAINMPVEYKYLDGTTAKEECLKVTYTGVDSLGNVFENTEDAPVNVGVYTVVATYKEYDEVTGELMYFGINVGTMAIEPAASSVDVQYTEVEYDGNPHMATIVNEKNLDMVKIIVDEKGNVNIILPEEWGVDSTTVKVDDIDEAIDVILEELAKAEEFSAAETAEISALIAEIEKALSDMDDAATAELKAAVSELKEAVKLGAGAIYAADLEIKDLLKEINTPEAAEILNAIEELEETVKEAISTEDISAAIAEVKAVLKEMKGSVSEEVRHVLDEIEALANQIGVSEVSKLVTEIETALNDIKAEVGASGIKSISINGKEPVDVGTYKVTAIVAGRNYKVSSDTDTLVIYPETISVTIDVVKKVENKGKEKMSPEGFEFVLEDGEGKVIDKQYSDKDGKAQFELTFDKDDIGDVFDYVVKETNTGKEHVTYSTDKYEISIEIALDGNELSETVDGDLTCKFVNVYDYTKPSDSGNGGSGSGSGSSKDDDSDSELEGVYYPESPSASSTGTSTGDNANILGYAALILVAGAALVILFLKKKKA